MSKDKMLTESEVIAIIADAINEPATSIAVNAGATDFRGWDSMATMVIMTALNERGIELEEGDAAALQSVQGTLDIVRKLGRLS